MCPASFIQHKITDHWLLVLKVGWDRFMRIFTEHNMEISITDPLSGRSIENDLQMFKDWLKLQPHLPKDFDDELLLLFVKGSKSLEIAKQQIDKFCTTNTRYDLLTPNIDTELREVCEFSKMFFLPDPLPNGCRVLMTLGKNLEKYNHRLNNVRLRLMALTIKRMHPDLPGLVVIMDSTNCGLNVIQKMSITESIAAAHILQNYIPISLKLVLTYNSNAKTETLVNGFVIPFLSKKTQERVIVTSEGVSVLNNYMPPEMLPCDLPGGKAPSSDQLDEYWMKLLESQMDWFKQIIKFQADEEKRPPDVENRYGVDGTFRKLNVD